MTTTQSECLLRYWRVSLSLSSNQEPPPEMIFPSWLRAGVRCKLRCLVAQSRPSGGEPGDGAGSVAGSADRSPIHPRHATGADPRDPRARQPVLSGWSRPISCCEDSGCPLPRDRHRRSRPVGKRRRLRRGSRGVLDGNPPHGAQRSPPRHGVVLRHRGLNRTGVGARRSRLERTP